MLTKKCITQVAALTLAMALIPGVSAQSGLKLAPNAPESYTVVRGDTLWDIAGRFLDEPWRWPDIWDLNRKAIKDPHWIYPGDLIYMDNSTGRPRLRLGRPIAGNAYDQRNNDPRARGIVPVGGNGKGTLVMQPMIRSKPLNSDAISTINTSAIEAFLNKPLIIEEGGLEENPRVVATQEGRVYLGRGDKAYVRGIKDESVKQWHIYRPSRPLLDPDTRRPIAWEALWVGSASLEKFGDPATLRINNTAEEIGVDDRLMPADEAKLLNVVPRAPGQPVNGRIITVYRGVSQVGKNSVVAINRGEKDGLDVGHVLGVKLTGRTIKDRKTREWVKLPDESVGYMLVFRTFDRVSYALVMEASQSISVGDAVTSP